MSETRDPNRDQQLPRKGKDDVGMILRQAISERRAYGIRKYGRPLETNNGRDSLKDAWEEALDLLMYLTQTRLERGDSLDALVFPGAGSQYDARGHLRTQGDHSTGKSHCPQCGHRAHGDRPSACGWTTARLGHPLDVCACVSDLPPEFR